MDPLSEICASIQVRKAMYTRLEAAAPWSILPSGLPRINFVLLVRGACLLRMDTLAAPIALGGGDVFITLDQAHYKLYDGLDSTVLDCQSVLASTVDNYVAVGGSGATSGSISTFVSGTFELEAIDALPLLSVLPPFLHLRAGDERGKTFEAVLDMLANEVADSGGPAMGAEALSARLFEIMFIHAVRIHCKQQDTPVTGWLAVMSDPHLKHAAQAMHDKLDKEWTLDMLAQEAGMSRTSFAARFKTVASQTPLDYLTRWRMHKASKLLLRDTLSLAQVARAVGYQSEAAFNRMFTRTVGISPGRYRKAASLSA